MAQGVIQQRQALAVEELPARCMALAEQAAPVLRLPREQLPVVGAVLVRALSGVGPGLPCLSAGQVAGAGELAGLVVPRAQAVPIAVRAELDHRLPGKLR